MMRVLALDVGDKRVGVAISDPTQFLARSLKVIQRGPPQEDFAAVSRLVEEHEVERVVVGYPRSLDGTVGEQADKVERYAEGLAEALDVPVVLWDERFSTVSAERLMREAGLRGKKKRERIDAVAAAVILQDYLDSR
ncbi:MAG: Holliday junction resolvase RuvX [Anaerolineales bacterium]|nr:Holliday junction resolvase RuvX [Anaerolineales bacterium]